MLVFGGVCFVERCWDTSAMVMVCRHWKTPGWLCSSPLRGSSAWQCGRTQVCGGKDFWRVRREQGTLFFLGKTGWTFATSKEDALVFWSLTRALWPISKPIEKTYPNIEACGTTRGHSGSFWWSSQGLLAALGIPGYLNICDPVWYPEGDSSWPSFENDLSTIPPRCGKFDDARKCWVCLKDGVDLHVFACPTERRDYAFFCGDDLWNSWQLFQVSKAP